MNLALKLALVKACRLAYRTAALAGLTPKQLHSVLYGLRQPRPEERAALSRVLGVGEDDLFPSAPPAAA